MSESQKNTIVLGAVLLSVCVGFAFAKCPCAVRRSQTIDTISVPESKVERRHGFRNFRNGIERGEKGLEAAQKAMPEFAEGMKHIDAAVQVFNDVFNGESPTAAPSTTTSQEIPIPVVEPATPPKAVVPPTIIDTPKDDAEDDASCSGGSCQNGQCQQYRSRRWGR